MTKRKLAPALLAALVTAGAAVAPVHADHAKAHAGYAHSPQFMMHHGDRHGGAATQRPARLGVAISALEQRALDAMSLEYGVRVERVMSGSAADKAGLQAGDVVTEVDGRPAYSPRRMQHLVGAAGDAAVITLRRDGETIRLDATLVDPAISKARGKAILGIRIQEMSTDLKEAFGAEGERGVLISQVQDGSAAEAAGLKAGDVIVAIGQRGIAAVDDVHQALRAHSPGDAVQVSVLRDRKLTALAVTLDGAPVTAQQGVRPHGWGHGHGQAGHGHPGHYGMMPGHGCIKRSMMHRRS